MSTQNKFPKQKILGVEVDSLGISQAIEHITELLKNRRGAVYIVKPYVEHVERAAREPGLRRLLNQAYLSLPDGVSLNWAAYFNTKTSGHWWDVISSLTKIIFRPLELHLALPNHSWGTNFTYSLLETAAEQGLSVYLVGSPKGKGISHTKKWLEKVMPALKIIGALEGRDPELGKFSEGLEKHLHAQVARKQPDIVLMGIGFPQQERLAARLARQLSHGVLIGEGGTFDFASFGGTLPKAPLWMQARGLEWLWRLIKEPRRLRRQLAIPRFIYRVYRAKAKARRR